MSDSMADTSTSVVAFFQTDHRRCDAIWSDLESAVDGGDEAGAAKLWKDFEAALRRHLTMEEEILFPAFEDATGMHGSGPPAIMRMEHTQMRAVLDTMAGCVARDDYEELVDQGDTLLMLIQQHNMKEEGMLYPMCDKVLGPQWPALHATLQDRYPMS